jgi:hypothetical protein
MATDEQLRAYAQSLPEIYREILAAFPRLEPNRKRGYGLAFQSLLADFESRGLEFDLGQIIQACEQLQQHGLMEIKHRIFVHPTETGERLVTALSDQEPSPSGVPALPLPPA